jgi:hypothetical protein
MPYSVGFEVIMAITMKNTVMPCSSQRALHITSTFGFGWMCLPSTSAGLLLGLLFDPGSGVIFLRNGGLSPNYTVRFMVCILCLRYLLMYVIPCADKSTDVFQPRWVLKVSSSRTYGVAFQLRFFLALPWNSCPVRTPTRIFKFVDRLDNFYCTSIWRIL